VGEKGNLLPKIISQQKMSQLGFWNKISKYHAIFKINKNWGRF